MDAPEPPTTGEVARRPGPGRPRRRGERLLPPPQPARRRGRGGGVRRPPRGPPPPRPALAAPAPRPPPAAARRPGVGPRHHQRAEPRRAGRARHPGDDRVQHLRSVASGRATAPAPAPPLAWRPTARSSSSRPVPCRARTSPGDSRWRRPSAPPTGCSARPRTATDLSSNGWWPGRAARCDAGTRRGTGAWPTPTPPATRWCSRRRGRASATLRSSPRRTGGRSPSGPTRSAGSCRPSASAGSAPTTPTPWAPSSGRRTASLLEHNHAVAAAHFDVADLPRRLAAVLEGLGVPNS